MVFCPVVAAVMLQSRVVWCVHTSYHPTTDKRTENHGQWNAVWPPDDGRKDARNMSRNNRLPISHYLFHLVGLAFICLSKMHGHSNIKFFSFFESAVDFCFACGDSNCGFYRSLLIEILLFDSWLSIFFRGYLATKYHNWISKIKFTF